MGIENRKNQLKRLLLQYIRDARLRPGDKLPGQSVLRQRFGCGGGTFAQAVAELCSEGVLETRDKRGVYLVDSQFGQRYSRRIGIVAGQFRNNMTLALLLAHLVEMLNECGCRAICFYQSPDAYDHPFNGLEDISGLRLSVESGELDGVLFTILATPALESFLSAHGIGFGYLGLRVPGRHCYYLDYETVIHQSVSILNGAGCSRIAMFYMGWEEFFAQAFRSSLAERGLDSKEADLLSLNLGKGNDCYHRQIIHHGQAILDRPKAKRPDACLILDDMLTLFLQDFLSVEKSRWQPVVISLRNAEIYLPIHPSRFGHWLFSLRDFTRFALEHFIVSLTSPQTSRDGWGFLPVFDNSAPTGQNIFP
ncbi:MAG: GntR family transcriptional regulator [Victivallales bacterium]|nr:GntR family transcriptional regulator [Victivallales bacterium]